MMMKAGAVFFTLLLALAAQSQPPQFSQEQMQQMMQQAAEMQACFAEVDQSKLEALGDRAKRMEAEIKGLCREGKRDAAERKAIAFGMEISNSTEMKALRKCGEMVRSMMPPLLFEADPEQQGDNGHICDGM